MTGAKILLINPWIYDVAAYDMWAKPLGLLYLGAILRACGAEISLIDCLNADHPLMPEAPPRIRCGGQHKYYRKPVSKPAIFKDIPRHYSRYGISPEAFSHDLKKAEKPDIVLVTSHMTYWYQGVHEAIRAVKNKWPDVPVILGGIYATLCHEHARSHSGADFVIAGPGENDLFQLIANLRQRPLQRIPAFEAWPYPAFDLLERLGYVCIQTSRGCPYRCTYCASHLLFDGLQRRAAASVADEIRHWRDNYGVFDFAFYDDALLTDSAYAADLLERLGGQGVRFHCPNALHVRAITPDLARALTTAGFQTIRLGFETADAVRQQKTGGKVSNRQFETSVRNLQAAGYDRQDIGVYILCGLPGQHAAEVRDSLTFVRQAGAKPIITEFSPIPGTAIWDEAVRCSPFPLTSEPLSHNNSLLPCRWEGLSYGDYLEIKNLARN